MRMVLSHHQRPVFLILSEAPAGAFALAAYRVVPLDAVRHLARGLLLKPATVSAHLSGGADGPPVFNVDIEVIRPESFAASAGEDDRRRRVAL